MGVFRNHLAVAVLLGALLSAGPSAQAAVLTCKLSVDDGQRVSPPVDMTIRVSPDEYVRWTDGGWTRNQCGAHGGAAPDVLCAVHDGHFQADFAWESNVGRLERHVVLNLANGDLVVRDHNGLEQKGVCLPGAEPAPRPPKPPAP